MGGVILFILVCAAIFIGLPVLVLVLVGIGRAVIWLFKPVSLGDPA